MTSVFKFPRPLFLLRVLLVWCSFVQSALQRLTTNTNQDVGYSSLLFKPTTGQIHAVTKDACCRPCRLRRRCSARRVCPTSRGCPRRRTPCPGKKSRFWAQLDARKCGGKRRKQRGWGLTHCSISSVPTWRYIGS